MVNIREIKDLIQLMNDNDLTEMEVEFDGNKIKLRKGSDQVVYASAPQQPVQAAVSAAPQAQTEAAAETPAAGQSIKSPMVGTYYASPAPDADPYVTVGSKVEVGQVVCIVEAMKLMNEIKSEISGTVTQVHSKNGEPVEFGQPLFTIQ